MYGYNGKVVYVDLTKESFEVKDLEPEIARAYLGGTGLSAKIVYDLLSKEDYLTLKENPFSEINPLIFATGPVTGTIRPSSGRYTVSGISPLTRIWGEGSSGGAFCISLRNCGYDAIVFLGKSTKLTYIFIDNGKIEFKDAFSLQGKDCYETQSLIVNELNDSGIRVACIGPAGENLVKYGVIINDEGRAIGRCGLGAIMGSKNLKALAIKSTSNVEIANKEQGKKLRQTEEKSSIGSLLFYLYGTNMYLDLGMVNGDTPGYYFTESEFLAEKLTSKTLKEDYPVFSYGCAGCIVKCGKSTIIKEGGKEITVDGPEYESVASFGPLCGLFDSRYVILASHLCNEYGVDTISCGVSIAFLIYLVENKLGIEIIKSFLNDIQSQDIKWGNGKLILKLIKKISKREGIGKILAEGVRTMAEILEVDPELAAHVKGLEMPMHDPRAFAGQALSYITGVTGANHNKCDWYNTELGSFKYPTLHIKRSRGRYNIKGRERGISKLQDLRAIDDSAVNCNMVRPSFENIIGYINAATGFNYDKKALMEVGERINNLKRLISCNLGITREDDKLPKHLLKVLSFGRTTGVKLELNDNLKKYYSIRGWNWETGRPIDEKLNQLGISIKSE